MTDREKKLGLLVLAMVVGWGGWKAWGWYSDALDLRRSDQLSAEQAQNDIRFERMKADAAVARLAEYKEQSLPADPQQAQLEYRAWLFDELDAAGLDFDDVTLTDRRPSGDSYTALTYSAKADGDLAAVTKFLHAFYQAPLLHKITTLKLIPQDRGKLSVTLTVQSLAVNGAERDAGLPSGETGRPSLGEATEYVASIVGRDVFREYVPPPPPRPPAPPRKVVKRDPPPPKPKFDDAAHAYLTGVVRSGPRLQAWITVRTTGDVLRLYEGDALKVGQLDGTVESVSARQIVFRTDDGRFATRLGSHLREGEALEAEDAVF